MGDIIDFWITVDKEEVSYRIGEGKSVLEKHELQRDLASIQQLKGTDLYGKKLFQSLFQNVNKEELRSYFEKGMEEENWSFHFRINVKDPQFDSLYWELLQDGEGAMFGLHSQIFLSRSTSAYELRSKPTQVDKARVLIVISAPVDIGKVKKEGFINSEIIQKDEASSINQELNSNDLDCIIMEGPTSLKNIRHHLDKGYKDKSEESNEFNVLYVISNGLVNTQGSYILLENDEDKKATPIDGKVFGQAIQEFKLKLVIFSPGQFSIEQSQDYTIKVASSVVNFGIPASIALRNGMKDTAVKYFMRHFFKKLVESIKGKENKPIDQLINSLRSKVFWENNQKGNDWVKPVLFIRGDGFLFQIQPAFSRSENRAQKDIVTHDFHSGDKRTGDGILVFCCYSSEDSEYMDMLYGLLKGIKKRTRGLISDIFLDQEKIGAGHDFTQDIEKALVEAELILLLVSRHFDISDFIQDVELPKAIEKFKANKAHLIPIRVGALNFEEYEYFKNIIHLPRGEKALVEMGEKELEAVMYNIQKEIQEEIKKWKEKKKISKDGHARATISKGHGGLEARRQIHKEGVVTESSSKNKNSSKERNLPFGKQRR